MLLTGLRERADEDEGETADEQDESGDLLPDLPETTSEGISFLAFLRVRVEGVFVSVRIRLGGGERPHDRDDVLNSKGSPKDWKGRGRGERGQWALRGYILWSEIGSEAKGGLGARGSHGWR